MSTYSSPFNSLSTNDPIDLPEGSLSRSAALCAGICRVPALHLLYAAENTWPRGYQVNQVHVDSDLVSIVALHTMSGSGSIFIDSKEETKELPISGPSVTFYRHRDHSRIVTKDHWHIRWYEFVLGEDIEHLLLRSIPVSPSDSDEATYQTIKKFLSSENEKDLTYSAVLFAELLYRWLRNTDLDLRSPEQQIVDQAAAFFRIGLQQGVTVESAAEHVGIHASSLRRLFHIHLRMSPKQYLDRVRFQEAKNLLQQGALVKQVARTLGFENQSQFSRFFKKRSNFTPKAYRGRFHPK